MNAGPNERVAEAVARLLSAVNSAEAPFDAHADYVNDHRLRYVETLTTFFDHFALLRASRVASMGGTSPFEEWLSREFEFTLDVVESDVRQQWPAPNEAFDTVLSLEVLEHLNDNCVEDRIVDTFEYSGIRAALAEAFRCLKHGGLLLLTTPNAASVDLLLQVANGAAPWQYRPHVREYTIEELVGLLQEAGFTVEGWRTFFAWNCDAPASREQGMQALAMLGGLLEDRGDDIALWARKPLARPAMGSS